MDKKNLAFGKTNFILLAVGMLVIIIGFVLMGGPGSTETTFMRVKVAPVVTLLGFVSIIYAIVHKPKDDEGSK